MRDYHGKDVRDHPEWRGSYEGAHEICTSLIGVPLRVEDGEIVGMIKIENHVNSEPVYDFKDLDDPNILKKVKRFGDKHKKIMKILADSAILAIQQVLYEKGTYKKLFGTEILRKIEELKKDANSLVSLHTGGLEVYSKIEEFYREIKVKIEDIGGIEEIHKRIERLENEIAQSLNLHCVLGIISNVGPAFETLLGTDVRYREHFMHQFHVFLLGYYLVNKNTNLRELLSNYMQKKYNLSNKDVIVDHILRIWFITSIFHDFAYSIGKIENWLETYFKRVKVSPKFTIRWPDIFTDYEIEKIRLIRSISCSIGSEEDKVVSVISDAFIKEHDHGVVSALVLWNILRDRIDEIVLNEACCSIALHTDTIYSQLGKPNKLKIGDIPFGFLLVFCDSVQEWGRPQMATLLEKVSITLKDVDADDKKIEAQLQYGKLTDEQSIEAKSGISCPTQYWSSENNVEFKITAYKEGETQPMGPYTFPKQ